MPTHVNVCVLTVAVIFILLPKADGVSYNAVPLPTAVLLGHTATLHCSFYDLSPEDVVIWNGPPGMRAITSGRRVDPNYPRHQVVGDVQKGEYHLQIRDARLEDGGAYKCNIFGLSPREAEVTVVVPVPQPPTLRGAEVPAKAGQQLELGCISSGGHPPPQLTWYNGTEPFTQQHVRLQEREGQVELDLVLRRLTRWDNGMNLTCRVTQPFPEITPTLESWRVLQVHYPPRVSVPTTSVRVMEGKPAALVCLVDSNPSASISWTKQGRPLLLNGNIRKGTFRIPKTSRQDTGVYRCTADNGVSPIGVGTVSLEILYPPLIDPSLDEKITVLQGDDDFSLDCLVQGNPKPQVRWRRKDTKLYWKNPLEFHRVRYDVDGMYQCVATSHRFPEKTKDVLIDVVGKPYLQGEGNTAVVAAAVGETIRLGCTIVADPLPSVVEWAWRDNHGMETKLDSARVRIVTTRRNQEMTSTFTIPDVAAKDNGNYVCKTTNMFGSAKRNIHLEIKESLPKIVVIVSITAGAVLVVTAAAVVMIIAKKKGWICKSHPDVSYGLSSSRPMPPVPKYVYNTGTIDSGVEDLEMQEMYGTLKPRPPPRIDKGWDSLGRSYTGLVHSTSLPPYTPTD